MSASLGPAVVGEEAGVVIRVGVHWGELDSFGHVNNARYFTWFESARIALFQRVGLARAAGHALAPILARTSCDFLRQVRWPAEVEVRVEVTRLGRTSFTTTYEAVQIDLPEPVVVARGEGVLVLVDSEGRPTTVPDELRAALARFGKSSLDGAGLLASAESR